VNSRVSVLVTILVTIGGILPLALRWAFAPSAGALALSITAAIASFLGYARWSGRRMATWSTLESFLARRLPVGGSNTTHFFLSYCRDNANDPGDEALVKKFFEDLDAEVRQVLPGRLKTAGFWDQTSLAHGVFWKVKLLQALNSCRTLVALCSPAYYESQNCRNEVEFVFDRAKLTSEPLELSPVLRVQWVPGGNPAAIFGEIQDALKPLYGEVGLRDIMLDPGRQVTYRKIVTQVSNAVLAASPGPPSFAPAEISWSRGLAGPWQNEPNEPDGTRSSQGIASLTTRRSTPSVAIVSAALLLGVLRLGLLGWGEQQLARARHVLGGDAACSSHLQAAELCHNIGSRLDWIRAPQATIDSIGELESLLKNSPCNSES
jgi:hypothetical protein